jgi:hypothetical protein
MSRTITKSNLLATMALGRKAWQALLNQIDEAAMLEPGVEGVWSVKEIVAHVAGYEQYFSAYIIDVQRDPLKNEPGMTAMLDSYYQQHLDGYHQVHPNFPERLDDLNEDQLNALFAAACQDQSVQEVLLRERQAYQRLLTEVQALSEAKLTEQHRDGSLIERIPNQCYAHYEMHMPAIERWWTQRNR